MECKVDALIEFPAFYKLKLSEGLDFASPSGPRITLTPTKDNDLSVQITLDANTTSDAKTMAEIELDRISNLLSYFHNVPIQRSKIMEITCEQLNAEGKQITSVEKMALVGAAVSIIKQLEPKSVQKLRHHLEKEYSLDFTDIISWWKVAISLEEPTLKYIFLYSLMEYLFSDKTKELTDWIKKREPLVEMHQPNEYRHYCYTNYTYLRDSLHHRKEEGFPRQQDINKLLPKFQDFVRDRIKETHGIDYA